MKVLVAVIKFFIGVFVFMVIWSQSIKFLAQHNSLWEFCALGTIVYGAIVLFLCSQKGHSLATAIEPEDKKPRFSGAERFKR